MEEIKHGGIVIKKSDEIITHLEDMDNFKQFKVDVMERISKLEEEVKKIKAVKQVEFRK